MGLDGAIAAFTEVVDADVIGGGVDDALDAEEEAAVLGGGEFALEEAFLDSLAPSFEPGGEPGAAGVAGDIVGDGVPAGLHGEITRPG